ncbi:hypothetical protein D0T08_21420 [Emticicia sp. C21]|nr:hypothetical protein D0T08_21420 [Emticicia sp. C21]
MKYSVFQEFLRRGKELADIQVSGRSFKRAIVHFHQYVFSELVKVLTTKVEPEKVTHMVGTFLSWENNSLQVTTTKVQPEMVTHMMGTFLNDDIVTESFRKSWIKNVEQVQCKNT